MSVRILGNVPNKQQKELALLRLECCTRCENPLITERFEFQDPQGGAYPTGLHGAFLQAVRAHGADQ